MNELVMVMYLMFGQSVGSISKVFGKSRPSIRATLKEWGISVRRDGRQTMPARDKVCAAVKSAGFTSFHQFAMENCLSTLSQQAQLLGVPERSLTRVYSSYRSLLSVISQRGLDAAHIYGTAQ